MKDHLSHEMLIDYAAQGLDPNDLLAADDHLAECELCRSALPEIATLPSVNAAFSQLVEESPVDLHLQFGQLAAYVDGEMDAIEIEIADLHLHDCSACREDIEAIRSVASEGIVYPQSSVTMQGASNSPSFADKIRAFLGTRALKLALPMLLLLVGAAAVAFWFSIQPDDPDLPNIAVVDSRPESDEPVIIATTPSDQDANDQTDEPAEIAAITLKDGAGELKIGADGRVMSGFAGEYDTKIAAMIRSGDPVIAAEAKRMRTDAGVLMGPQGDAAGLRVLSPIGKVQAGNRPEFTWSHIPDAESYTVEIYDMNFNRVATSPELTANRWQATTPLPRGREYSWQVIAIKDGETHKAPTRPAPEAKFYIVSANKLSEIERAKRRYGNSNLLLGLLYAEAGLLDDAEREFQALVRKNPGSTHARRLLNRIRAAK